MDSAEKKPFRAQLCFQVLLQLSPSNHKKKDQMLQWKNDKDKSEHLI